MTDLNKEREEFESDLAEHLIERDSNGFYLNDEIQNYWEKHLLKVQIKELKAELERAKAQAVPEHIITLQRNGEVFKFDLLDLLRRSLKSSKVLKTRENWSHVSKMVGLGSTTSTLLCKEMNVDPDGTVFVVSESGAEG